MLVPILTSYVFAWGARARVGELQVRLEEMSYRIDEAIADLEADFDEEQIRQAADGVLARFARHDPSPKTLRRVVRARMKAERRDRRAYLALTLLEGLLVVQLSANRLDGATRDKVGGELTLIEHRVRAFLDRHRGD